MTPSALRRGICALWVVLSAGRLGALTFDDSPWARTLAHSVDATGQVDFAGLRAHPEDLNLYLSALARTSPRTQPNVFPTRDHALAYWINAYNACVLKGVLRSYPLRSVRDVRRPWGFFLREEYVLGGQSFTLDQLENEVFRREFRDPRILFLITRAARGGPRLRPEPIQAESLPELLERGTREFLANPAHCRIEGRRITLSALFKWHRRDFIDYLRRARGIRRGDLLDFVALYSPLGKVPDGQVDFADFDWSLAEQRPAVSPR